MSQGPKKPGDSESTQSLSLTELQKLANNLEEILFTRIRDELAGWGQPGT